MSVVMMHSSHGFRLVTPVLDCVLEQIMIFYSERGGDEEGVAQYGGEKFYPSESEEDLSYKVLNSSVRSISYQYYQYDRSQ